MDLPLSCEQRDRSLLPKRPTNVSFSPAGVDVLVSDAFGDVFRLPIDRPVNLREEEDQDIYRMLGHFSTLTSVASSEHLIATGDRDGKLRISRFPDAFVIESFCLGHTEFITCLEWVCGERLVSGAGDGTVRLWEAKSGCQLGVISCTDRVPDGIAMPIATGKGHVVTSIRVFPTEADIGIFTLYGCSQIFVASGLQSANPVHFRIVTCLEHGHVVTGTAIDKDGRLLVSPSPHSLRATKYVCKSGSVERVAGEHCEKTTASVPSNSSFENSCGEGADKSADLTRFEWLNQQRKKEMVPNWKGKKRKHVEM